MSTVYADKWDLAAYIDPDAATPTVPDLATVRLRYASGLVRDATRGARYSTDATGLPTDPVIREVFREATCEHASALVANNIDPRTGAAGLKPIVTTKSLGGAAVSYGQSADVQQAIVDLATGTTLTPEAWAILQRAGLISNQVSSLSFGSRDVYVDSRPIDIATGRVIEA